MCVGLYKTMHLLGGGLTSRTCTNVPTYQALDYEVNGLASGRVRERSPPRTNQPNDSRVSDSSERCYARKNWKGAPGGSEGGGPKQGSGAGVDPGQGTSGGGRGRPRKEEIQARKAHKVSIWCTQEGHLGKD